MTTQQRREIKHGLKSMVQLARDATSSVRNAEIMLDQVSRISRFSFLKRHLFSVMLSLVRVQDMETESSTLEELNTYQIELRTVSEVVKRLQKDDIKDVLYIGGGFTFFIMCVTYVLTKRLRLWGMLWSTHIRSSHELSEHRSGRTREKILETQNNEHFNGEMSTGRVLDVSHEHIAELIVPEDSSRSETETSGATRDDVDFEMDTQHMNIERMSTYYIDHEEIARDREIMRNVVSDVVEERNSKDSSDSTRNVERKIDVRAPTSSTKPGGDVPLKADQKHVFEDDKRKEARQQKTIAQSQHEGARSRITNRLSLEVEIEYVDPLKGDTISEGTGRSTAFRGEL